MTLPAAIAELQRCWENPSLEAFRKMQSVLSTFALTSAAGNPGEGVELHRDAKHGFILLSYSEEMNQYRSPHDHGEAWVIYTVVEGRVEMGNYFKFAQPDLLIRKSREVLEAGDSRIYYPGEIHDTRCLSGKAVILRLTSSDLKREESLGRMRRYLQRPK